MSIKLKKIQRQNPLSRSQQKWYLTQATSGAVGIKEIASEIAERSSLTLSDVQGSLTSLVSVMPIFLKLGQSIRLEGFGTFRVSVSSDGTDTAEELTARHVKKARVVFIPSTELKQSLDSLSFEVVA